MPQGDHLLLVIHDVICFSIYRGVALIDMNDCLLSICMSVINPYTCLSDHRTLHMKYYNWILRARVGKKCLWHDVLSWIWTDA